MADIEIKLNNINLVQEALKSQCLKALEMCGFEAERYAKESLTKSKAVDTGNLRNSVTHEIDQTGENEYKMSVGTNTEYAIYVEMGTGKYTAGGRQDPWAFQDAKGDWHMTHGMKARPYIKPAISANEKTYKTIIKDKLKA